MRLTGACGRLVCAIVRYWDPVVWCDLNAEGIVPRPSDEIGRLALEIEFFGGITGA